MFASWYKYVILQLDRRVGRARVRARRSTRLSRPSASFNLPLHSSQVNNSASTASNGDQNNSITIVRPDSNTNNVSDDNSDEDTSSTVETDTESETGNNSDNNNINSDNIAAPNGRLLESMQSLLA